MSEVGGAYLHPSIELGHYGEGLYRTVVALAAPAQHVRVGALGKTHFKGVGFWITSTDSTRGILGNRARRLRRELGRVRGRHERGGVQGN
jgi:uncharacterized protein